MKWITIIAVLWLTSSVPFLNSGLPAEARPIDLLAPLPPTSEVQISILAPEDVTEQIASPFRQFLAKKNLLRMVLIKVKSSHEVMKLRQMKLDIVRVRPDPKQPPGKDSPSGGYIVEAVLAPGILSKLEAQGFEVSEIRTEN